MAIHPPPNHHGLNPGLGWLLSIGKNLGKMSNAFRCLLQALFLPVCRGNPNGSIITPPLQAGWTVSVIAYAHEHFEAVHAFALEETRVAGTLQLRRACVDTNLQKRLWATVRPQLESSGWPNGVRVAVPPATTSSSRHPAQKRRKRGLRALATATIGGSCRLFGGPCWLEATGPNAVGCARARQRKHAESCLAQESKHILRCYRKKKESCPLGEKRYRKDWKYTLSVPKGQSALRSVTL